MILLAHLFEFFQRDGAFKEIRLPIIGVVARRQHDALFVLHCMSGTLSDDPSLGKGMLFLYRSRVYRFGNFHERHWSELFNENDSLLGVVRHNPPWPSCFCIGMVVDFNTEAAFGWGPEHDLC